MADSIDGQIRYRVRRMTKECRFDVYAAPVAIEAELNDALAARRVLDRYIDWLTRLAGERKAQEKAGIWPANVEQLLKEPHRG